MNLPTIVWGQHHNVIFIKVPLDYCKFHTINIESSRILFKGTGGNNNNDQALVINLYKAIDPEKSFKIVRERNIKVMLKKKEESPGFWPQLTKENHRFHWLKMDLNMGQDEGESDEDFEGPGGGDLEDICVIQPRRTNDNGWIRRPSLNDLDPLKEEDSDHEDISLSLSP